MAPMAGRQRKGYDSPTMKKNKSVDPTALPSDTRTVPLHQEIATQAYILWQHYGQPAGQDVSIWLEAERQVLGVDKQVNQQGGGAVEARPLGTALATAASLPDPETVSERRSYR
jgi:hypothetical protein